MNTSGQIDKDIKDIYCHTCSDVFNEMLTDRGLVQPLSRTILIGRIQYASRFDVKDYFEAVVSRIQAGILDPESRITGLLITQEDFFYHIVESSDEALGDIVQATSEAVSEGTILEAKVVRTGGITERLFKDHNVCIVLTPRFVEERDDYYNCYNERVRRASIFVEDSNRRMSRIGEDSRRRRTSQFAGGSDNNRRASRSGEGRKRRTSRFDGISKRRSSRFSTDGNCNRRTSRSPEGGKRRTSRLSEDSARNSRTSRSVEDGKRRMSRLSEDSTRNSRTSRSVEDDKRRTSGLSEDSTRNRLTSLFAEDGNKKRRKTRFAEDSYRKKSFFVKECNEDESDVPTIARMLKTLDEAVFVLASCVRFTRPEGVEARVNELLPTGVLLNRDELEDLWVEKFFQTVDGHVSRYQRPEDYSSYLEEEWPPTGPAHDPSDFFKEVENFENKIEQSLLEEERKRAKSEGIR